MTNLAYLEILFIYRRLQDGRLNREDLISGMNTLHGLVVPKPQARRSARDDEIAKTLQQMFEERNLTIEDLMTKVKKLL